MYCPHLAGCGHGFCDFDYKADPYEIFDEDIVLTFFVVVYLSFHYLQVGISWGMYQTPPPPPLLPMSK